MVRYLRLLADGTVVRGDQRRHVDPNAEPTVVWRCFRCGGVGFPLLPSAPAGGDGDAEVWVGIDAGIIDQERSTTAERVTSLQDEFELLLREPPDPEDSSASFSRCVAIRDFVRRVVPHIIETSWLLKHVSHIEDKYVRVGKPVPAAAVQLLKALWKGETAHTVREALVQGAAA